MLQRVANWLTPTVVNSVRTPVSREILGVRAPVWTLALLTSVKSLGLSILLFTAARFPIQEQPAVWEQWFGAITLALMTVYLLNPWFRVPDWFLHLGVSFGALVCGLLLAAAHNQGTLVGNFLTMLGYAGYAALWFSKRQLTLHVAFLLGCTAVGVYIGYPAPTANATWLPSAAATVLVAWVLHSLVHEIHTLATRDVLTGAFNRNALGSLLGNDMSGSGLPRPCSVVVCDLNDFKRINDTKGHVEGDRLLTHVAEVMRTNVRPHDFIVRSGGDEFLLLLTGTTEAGAETVMRRILGQLEVSIAYGIAQWNVGVDFDDVVARADMLMYRDKAKRSGDA